MEIRKGTITKLSSTVNVSGSGGGNGGVHVSTTHIATFLLDQQAVVLASEDVPFLHEGDTVVVAGPLKAGILQAYAYRNRTIDVSAKTMGATYSVLGSLFAVIGVGTMLVGLALATDELGLGALLVTAIGAVFLIVGVKHVRLASQAQDALTAVSRQ